MLIEWTRAGKRRPAALASPSSAGACRITLGSSRRSWQAIGARTLAAKFLFFALDLVRRGPCGCEFCAGHARAVTRSGLSGRHLGTRPRTLTVLPAGREDI